jgi:hypothetical protein
MDHTVDTEINHLERVLSLEIAHKVFSVDYWRSRVMQLTTTPGLVTTQRLRLQRLFDLLEDAEHGASQSQHGAGDDRR